MISEKLSEGYTKAEDKYFDLLDFLDKRGLPVYAYSDFFEQKGVPSFVVSVALLLILLILLSLFFASQSLATDQIVLGMRDASGNPLNNVTITLLDEQGNVVGGIKNLLKGDGDVLQLPQLSQGTKLKLIASKNGYQSVTADIMLGAEKYTSQLRFDRDFVGIDASIILVDAETKTKISGAVVLASWDAQEYRFYADANGFYKATGVPAETTVILKVKADGYNDLTQETSFTKGVTKTFQVTPSTASFTGKAALLVTVSDEEGNAINDAKVTIYKQEGGDILLQDYTAQGSVAGTIQAGIALRITAEKEGYLTSDTEREGGSYTIRKSEEKIDIFLRQGGNKLTVTARDSGLGLALDNSIIQLFDLEGTKLAREVAGLQGAEFTGLDPTERILITAFKEDYLPGKKEILVGATENEEIYLTKATTANSFRLDIYSIDSMANSVGGAKITIKQLDNNGGKVPYGIDDLVANIAGYVYATVEKGKTYEVTSETEVMIGTTMIEVTNTLTDNKVYVKLSKKPNILEMRFKDPKGANIYGTAVVDALDGTNLYDGNIYESRIFLNTTDKETVEVSVILPDGNLFTENVYVKGKDIVEVIVYNKTASELAPTIEFVGLENEAGEVVSGITPNAFYWAKFNVVFPLAATSGGLHFRAGSDSVSAVESSNFAIFDLSATGTTNYFGKTYTPTPEPGSETLDRSNAGNMGEPNKWIEGVIQKPAGNYVVKVKIRASEFSAGKVQLHYRGWNAIGSEYYRTPQDDIIGQSSLSETKSGLYAETLLQEFTLYESLPECNENICLTLNFVDETEAIYSPTEFEAMQGKIYALEVELSAQESDYLQVVVTSPENISFVGTQAGTFNYIKDNGTTNTGTTQGFTQRISTTETEAQTAAEAKTTISLTKNSKQKVRFYFKGINVGTGQIKFSATGTTSIEKDLSFKIVKEKQLLVEVNPQNVLLGRNFTVKVTDEGLKGIESALVKILDKEGKVAKSVAGDATDGKGKSGNYRVQNDLGVGLYTVEVSVPTYATKAVPLLVTTQNVWSFPEEVVAKIPIGQKTTLVTAELANQSDFSITDISAETKDTDNFKVTVLAPPLLGKMQKQSVQIKVDYLGDAADTADETINITLKGMVEGKFFTQLSSTLSATYNKKAEESCLVIEPSSIKINLIGNQGSSDSEIIEVTNNCEEAVYLKARPRELTKRSGILISSEDISLNIGETRNITINASNGFDRTYSRDETYGFEIVYDSNYLTKRVSVSVRLINPNVALAYPAQITLWLAQNDTQGKAFAAQPLYVTNISEFPVEGIGFSVDTEYATGSNVKVTVEPSGTVNLEPKQSIIPAKLVVAQSSSTISEPVRSQIIINGKMGNLNNQGNDRYDYYENYYGGNTTGANSKTPAQYYAPKNVSAGYTQANTALGVVEVMVYYSGFDCLKAYPLDDLTYNLSLEGSQIAKRIKLQNTCAEPVQVTGATTPTMNRELLLFVPGVMVPNDGSEVVVNLAVASLRPTVKLENYPIRIQGITGVSQTPIQSDKLMIDILGGTAIGEEGKATKGLSISVCGEEGKKTINVPKLASGTDCANGYCDAKQAAEYIASRVTSAIKKAQSKAYSNQQQNQSFSCLARGFCTFGELGVSRETFDLYLQNDSVSAGVMEEAINKTTQYNSGFRGEITGGYRVEMANVSENIADYIASTGFGGRTIIIDRDIQGCGYYRISINGSFNASGGQVNWELPVVVVSSSVGGVKKKITQECKDSIENLANFTPIDKELTLANDLGTWLTSVEGDKIVEGVGKQLAKDYLGAEERYGSGAGSKIVVKQGALTNALAEMCLATGTGKKTTTLTVNSQIASATGIEKDKINSQISKMAEKALKGNFEDNCLIKSASGYNCVRLTSIGDIEGLKLSVPTKDIRVKLSETQFCLPATIYSKVPETLNFEIKKGEKFGGITKITIKESTDQKRINAQTTPAKNSTTGTTNTQKPNTATTTQAPNTNPSTTTPAATTGTQQPNTTPPTTTPPSPATGKALETAATPPTGTQQPSTTTATNPTQSTTNPQTTGTQPPATTPTTQPVTTSQSAAFSLAGKNVYEWGNDKATLDTAIITTVNTDSGTKTEHPFKKEIDICIEIVSEKNGVIPDHAKGSYLSDLEGSTFIVSAINKQAGKATGTIDEDGKITVRTASIHPDDLIALLGQHKIEPKLDYPYYVTFTWKDSAETIPSFDEYRNGLNNLGVNPAAIELSQKEGLLSNPATASKISDGKKNAIGSYLKTCAITSAACNGLTSLVIAPFTGGIGGIANFIKGMTVDVATDCLIPTVTVFEQDLRENSTIADTIYKGIFDIWSNTPSWLGGDWAKRQLEGAKLEEKSWGAAVIAAGAGKAMFVVPPQVKAIRAGTKTAEELKTMQKAIETAEKNVTSNSESIKNLLGETTGTTTTFGSLTSPGTGQIDDMIRGIDSEISYLGTLRADPILTGSVSDIDSALVRLTAARTKANEAKTLLNSAISETDKTIRLKKVTDSEGLIRALQSETDNASKILTNAADSYGPELVPGSRKLTRAQEATTKLKRPAGRLNVAKSQIDEVATKIGETKGALSKIDDLAKNVDDVTKNLSRAKTGNFKALSKGITKIGISIGCSILANAIGVGAYNDTLKAENKDLYNNASLIEDTEIAKDKTYKMYVIKTAEGPYSARFKEVVTVEENQEMIKDLAINSTTKKSNATMIYWTETVNNSLNKEKKAPYERPLTIYKMKNSVSKLDSLLKKYAKTINPTNREIILSRIRNPFAQEIIYKYTNESSEERLIGANGIYVDEMVIAAVIGTYYDEKQLEQEAKPKSTVSEVKQKALAIMDMLKVENNYAFTQADAEKITGGDKQKAEILYLVTNSLYVKEKK